MVMDLLTPQLLTQSRESVGIAHFTTHLIQHRP